jgi:hypothetical protein
MSATRTVHYVSPARVRRRAQGEVVPDPETAIAELRSLIGQILTGGDDAKAAVDQFRTYSHNLDVFLLVQRYYLRYLYTAKRGQYLHVPVEGQGGRWGLWVEEAENQGAVDVRLLPYMWVTAIREREHVGTQGPAGSAHNTIVCDPGIRTGIMTHLDRWPTVVRLHPYDHDGALPPPEWIDPNDVVDTYRSACTRTACTYKLVPIVVQGGADHSIDHSIDLYLDMVQYHILVFNVNGPLQYDDDSLRAAIRHVLVVMDDANDQTWSYTDKFADSLLPPSPRLDRLDGLNYSGVQFIPSDVGNRVFLSTGGVRGCTSDCMWQSLALLTGMMTTTAITHAQVGAGPRDNQHTWTMFLQGACMATAHTVDRANELASRVREQRQTFEEEDEAAQEFEDLRVARAAEEEHKRRRQGKKTIGDRSKEAGSIWKLKF